MSAGAAHGAEQIARRGVRPELGDEAGQVEAHELQRPLLVLVCVHVLHHVFVAAVGQDCETSLGAIQSLRQKTCGQRRSVVTQRRSNGRQSRTDKVTRHDDDVLRAECGT